MFALSPFAFPSISVPTGESDMELIFSTTLTSDVNSFSTGTLPTGYKAFKILAKARTDRDAITDTIRVYFNNDLTDANYQFQRVGCDSGRDPAGVSRDLPVVLGTTGASAQANFFSSGAILVLDPENTTQFKSFTFLEGRHTSSADSIDVRSVQSGTGVYRDQQAITSITFKSNGTMSDGTASDIVPGSSFHVYGLK